MIMNQLSHQNKLGILELKKVRTINHYLYFKLFYRLIKEFNKNRDYLFFEMKDLNHYVYFIKDLDIKEYIPKQIKFVKYMLEDRSLSPDFRNYLVEVFNNFRQIPS